jgi:hypothetical protein
MATTTIEQRAPGVSGTMIAAQFLALPLVLLVRGYVLSILWQWFVMPVFEIAALSVVQAIGIALFIHVATPADGGSPQSDSEIQQRIVIALTWPVFTLVLGWFVRLFA